MAGASPARRSPRGVAMDAPGPRPGGAADAGLAKRASAASSASSGSAWSSAPAPGLGLGLGSGSGSGSGSPSLWPLSGKRARPSPEAGGGAASASAPAYSDAEPDSELEHGAQGGGHASAERRAAHSASPDAGGAGSTSPTPPHVNRRLVPASESDRRYVANGITQLPNGALRLLVSLLGNAPHLDYDMISDGSDGDAQQVSLVFDVSKLPTPLFRDVEELVRCALGDDEEPAAVVAARSAGRVSGARRASEDDGEGGDGGEGEGGEGGEGEGGGALSDQDAAAAEPGSALPAPAPGAWSGGAKPKRRVVFPNGPKVKRAMGEDKMFEFSGVAVRLVSRSAEDTYPWKCESPECNKAFRTKDKVIRHVLVHVQRDDPIAERIHRGTEDRILDIEGVPVLLYARTSKNKTLPWKCMFEGCEHEPFRSKDKIEAHIKSRHLGAQFACSACRHEFTTVQALQVHLERVHKMPHAQALASSGLSHAGVLKGV